MTINQRAWPIIGALVGAALGLSDYAFAAALDLSIALDDRDVTAFVAAFIVTSNAAFGGVIGVLASARAELRAKTAVIEGQMAELEANRRRVIENEKLAAVGRLAAGVAHEVRNPLSIIRTSAAMLSLDDDKASEARRARDFICEEVDRLNAFVTALLAYSKPLKSKALESVSCGALLEEASARAGPEIEARDQSLRCLADDGSVEVDRALMISALLNLILNASQACGEGGSIALRARDEGGRAVIEVADDGPGLEPKLLEQAFEPFVTTRERGTGLGLAMAARIFEAHRAEAAFLTGRGLGPEGRGACLRIILPRGREA